MVKVLVLQENNTAEQYLCDLFECVNQDGSLYIARYEDGFLGGTATDLSLITHFEKYSMDHNISDWTDILEKEKILEESLRKIAGKNAGEISDIKEAERVLGQELFKIWNIYVRRFQYEGKDVRRIENLIHTDAYVTYRKGDGQFSETEEKLLEKYEQQRKKDYSDRLGEGICAYEVVLHAMRLERLFELNAPQMILNNERRDFLESLVLNTYARKRQMIVLNGRKQNGNY